MIVFAFLAWFPMILGALWVLWDLARTEPVPVAPGQLIYDHATDTYVRIPWS